MRFEELNWFDVENYLTQDDRVMIILGSCEQHAYLSLLSDVRIPLALADAASQQTGVIIAPSINFGVSPYFLAYPGTISLRASTMMDILEDFFRSFMRHGFKKILFINGHGGNAPCKSRLYELANEYSDVMISWYDWWQSHSVLAVAHKHHLKPSHASWLEAFQFNKIDDLPSETKKPPFISGLLSAEQAKEAYQDGSFGGPYEVENSIMDEIFEACLQDILQLLKFNSVDR